jgi:hypothetical protein
MTTCLEKVMAGLDKMPEANRGHRGAARTPEWKAYMGMDI